MESLKEQVMGRAAVHMPNIQDEAGVAGIKGIEKYKTRMLSPLGLEDAAIMPANVAEDIKDLHRLYDSYGITHIPLESILFLDYPNDLTLTDAILQNIGSIRQFVKTLKGQTGRRLEPFIHSRKVDWILKQLGITHPNNALSAEIVNNKHISQAQLRERGVLTPQGKLVHSLSEALKFWEVLKAQGYRKLAFKIPRSASGMGVFDIAPEQLPEYMLKYERDAQETGILLDGWLQGERVASPNIQYYIGETPAEDRFIACSDQILEGNKHKGNISNETLLKKNPRLQQDVNEIRNWVREQGYRGIIGIDFYITREHGQEWAYYMEINGRVNGSTPGALLANKLRSDNPNTAWGVQNNISLSVGTTFSDFVTMLDMNHLSYNPETKTGVLITNNSAIESHNKAMVVVIGDNQEQVQEILTALK